MKKQLLLCLLMFAFCSSYSQIIEFEDLNFKAILLQASQSNDIAFNTVIDTDGDGEITVFEAQQVGGLQIPSNSGIYSLDGIEHFSDLSYLQCNNNQLSSLDVSMLQNMTHLYVNDNQLQTLAVGSSMTSVHFKNNDVESFLFTGTDLIVVQCENNNLTALDFSEQFNLYGLDCKNNQISYLNVQNTRLFYLYCNNNQLTELDLTNVGANFSGPQGISLIIDCRNNHLTTINTMVTAFAQVKLYCGNNPDLESLYIKNGIQFAETIPNAFPETADIFFENNHNLQFICADDFNLDYVQAKLDAEGITGVTLTSNCNLDIEDTLVDDFAFFPNPIENELTISCPEQFNALAIYNMLGQTVHQTVFQSGEPINLQFLSSGSYVAEIASQTEVWRFKILKE